MTTVSCGPLPVMDLCTNSGNPVYVLRTPTINYLKISDTNYYQQAGILRSFQGPGREYVSLIINRHYIKLTSLPSTIYRRPLENPRRIA